MTILYDKALTEWAIQHAFDQATASLEANLAKIDRLCDQIEENAREFCATVDRIVGES